MDDTASDIEDTNTEFERDLLYRFGRLNTSLEHIEEHLKGMRRSLMEISTYLFYMAAFCIFAWGVNEGRKK